MSTNAEQRVTELEAQLREVDTKLGKLGDCLSMLGSDPQKNIDTIVESTCVIIGAACSLYNRLDDASQSLCTWSIFHEPQGFAREDAPKGHICYEATIKGGDRPVIIEDLRGTSWEESDVNVKKYGLKSYLGFPVKCRGKVVGSLCLVDVVPRKFSAVDVLVLNALAKAMAIEEDRKQVEKELEDKLAIIEHQQLRLKQKGLS